MYVFVYELVRKDSQKLGAISRRFIIECAGYCVVSGLVNRNRVRRRLGVHALPFNVVCPDMFSGRIPVTNANERYCPIMNIRQGIDGATIPRSLAMPDLKITTVDVSWKTEALTITH